jgi:RND superfamily putative drug exporter
VWIVLAIGLAVIAGPASERTSDNVSLPGSDSQKATDLLDARFPSQENGSNPVVIVSHGAKLDTGANKRAVDATVKALRAVPHVTKAVSPFSAEGSLSKDGRTGSVAVILNVGPADLTNDEANAVDDAAAPARKAGLETAVGGYAGQELSKPHTEYSEVIGLTAAVVILLFAFGTVVAMGMPIATAIIGLATGLSLISLLGRVVEVPTVGPTLAIMIGLGVGIDYALFVVTRHRMYMRKGFAAEEAAARAVATAGSAVVFAGTTVVIALCSLAVAGIPIVSALGYTAAVTVFVAVSAAVTLLPALLTLAGPRIDSLHLPIVDKEKVHDPRPHGWARWARGVARHPVVAAVTATALLVVLAIPVLSLVLGQTDTGADPKSTQSRKAYDSLTDGFGVGSNGPLLVSVRLDTPAKPDQAKLKQIDSQQQKLNQQQQQLDAAEQSTEQSLIAQGVPPQSAAEQAKRSVADPSSGTTFIQQQQQLDASHQKLTKEKAQASSPASDPRLTKLDQSLAKVNGVDSVSPPVVNSKGTAAVITVQPTTAPSANATEDLVRHVRDTTIPQTLANQQAQAYVGGQTAGYIDLADKISSKLPLVIGVVVGLSFIVLLLAFRSLAVPLQAAAMNLLSVGAAYGVLTFVFQEGHGAKLIGLDGAIPIVSYVPLMMFAILFGLSMDYQVFLLSQMREHYAESGDNTDSVVSGLASSGRVITSAALIMVSVFSSFLLNGDPTVKQFGMGMAVAIAVDATIVRCLLVPALMVLTGRANWWFPRVLERHLPEIGVEGEEGLPSPTAR